MKIKKHCHSRKKVRGGQLKTEEKKNRSHSHIQSQAAWSEVFESD